MQQLYINSIIKTQLKVINTPLGSLDFFYRYCWYFWKYSGTLVFTVTFVQGTIFCDNPGFARCRQQVFELSHIQYFLFLKLSSQIYTPSGSRNILTTYSDDIAGFKPDSRSHRTNLMVSYFLHTEVGVMFTFFAFFYGLKPADKTTKCRLW